MYKKSRTTSTFGSRETSITFYDEYSNDNIIRHHVVSFVIISTKPKIGELQLTQFEDKPIFFHCQDSANQKNYEDLLPLLLERYKEYKNTLGYKEQEPIQPTNTIPPELSDITSASEAILTADNICITFGAGLSAGYIPTLAEFFKMIGVEKEYSSDLATILSMENFVTNITNPANTAYILQIIKQTWQIINEHKILSTPAHIALFNIIQFLNHLGKKVFLYTDNVDGIHDKVGLSLSEISISSGEGFLISDIIYPSKEVLKSKKTVALICGQSFDFYKILNTLDTYCEEINSKLECFSFNTNLDQIQLFKGFDVVKLKSDIQNGLLTKADAFSQVSNYHIVNLKTSYIIGSCQDTLPLLYNNLLDQDLKMNHRFLIKWQQQAQASESFKPFSSLYNKNKPNAEANGYGPGAMVVYKQTLKYY